MATSVNGTSNTTFSKQASLRNRLEQALPSELARTTRYIRSPSKPSDSLFSALPGSPPEKTRLASHFLTVSVNPASLPQYATSSRTGSSSDVISFAIEVLVYTTKRLTTIFVSKVDSTSFTPRVRPSPIKRTVTTFLQWLADEELRKRPRRKIVISLFARAQAQYLFPGSADDKTKHVLDDRQLIKWWARTLDPILPRTETDTVDNAIKYQGYLTVPGYSGNELRSFMPSITGESPRWLPGHPLVELAQTRGIPEHAPPRCLLPRFPDDPKARFMGNLDDEIGLSQDSQVHVSPSKKKSGRWKSVTDLERFWEQMEFRQECSSGRVVGFLWLVIAPQDVDSDESFDVGNTDSQDSITTFSIPPSSDLFTQPDDRAATNARQKKRRKQLTGPIIPRQPRLKGGSSSLSNLSEMEAHANTREADGITVSKEGYDAAMHTMLNLDFSTLEFAIRSSAKWTAEVTSIAGLTGDFGVSISGTAAAEAPALPHSATSAPAVNDLGGMIRKKRKAVNEDGSSATITGGSGGETGSSVNMLGGAIIRKKPKSAV